MDKISTKDHWRRYWNKPDHQPQVVHEALLDNLLATIGVKGKKVLEVGAGMGGDSIYLSKKGAIVTALDFTREALVAVIENAKAAGVSVRTVQAEAKRLPFADDTFDVVFHQGFLEHFENPSELIDEQRRVLKTGGLIVVDVPQKYTTYTIKKHVAMALGKWFAGWEREFTIGELEKLLKTRGFEIVRSYGWGYFGQLHRIRYASFGDWYNRFWKWIEAHRIHLYLTWCIGVVARKQ